MANLSIPITSQGALVELSLGVSTAHQESIQSKGMRLPERITVKALIDTGASNTCVDISILRTLELNPTGFAITRTASSGAVGHRCNTYDISVMIPDSGPSLIVADLSASEIDLADEPFAMLIGRDILARCNFLYMGAENQAFLYY